MSRSLRFFPQGEGDLASLSKEIYAYLEGQFPQSTLLRTPAGKPYFFPENQRFFSISHTDGAGMLLLSNCPCGCDLQVIRPIREEIFQKVCTKREQEFLSSLSKKERHSAFFDLWTAKEAYVKTVGKTFLPLAAKLEVSNDFVTPLDPSLPALPLVRPDLPNWLSPLEYSAAFCLWEDAPKSAV